MAGGDAVKAGWQGAVTGLVSGLTFGALANFSPSFIPEDPLIVRYISKAIAAGTTFSLTAGAGALSNDILDDGIINMNKSSYEKEIIFAASIGIGTSIGYSINDYLSWNRYGPNKKISILNGEFGVDNIKYKKECIDYGEYNWGERVISLGDNGLMNHAIAKTSAAHELSHYSDYLSGMKLEDFSDLNTTEIKAHLLDMSISDNYNLPVRYWGESRLNLINAYSYSGYIPQTCGPSLYWYNLFY